MAKTRRRKHRTQGEVQGEGAKVPQSFVLKRGKLSNLVDEQTSDVRKVRRATQLPAAAAAAAAWPAARQLTSSGGAR